MSSKPKTAYRATQAVAKSLGLPGNLKHSVLETLINARQNGDENIVSEILRQTKEERDKRKKEKAEIRQTNYNLRIDINRTNSCTDIVSPVTPAKRPLGRPRKNKLAPERQPEQYQQHSALIEHPVVTQADKEAFLQHSGSIKEILLYNHFANNNNNNNDRTECQQRSCHKQMRTRKPETIFLPNNHRPIPRTTSCYSASVNPSQSIYNNFCLNNIYGTAQQEAPKVAPGYAFEKKIYKQMVQEDQCGISFVPNNGRYPTSTAHHYPQTNLYKQNRPNVNLQCSIGSPYQTIQQPPPMEYSYVPGGGYFQPQRTHNYFPSTPGPSSIQEPPPPYRNRPASVQNYVDPYLRHHNNDSFNFRYGVNNQAQMAVSTTPLSDSTISANEVDDNGQYDTSSSTLFNRNDLDTLLAAANTSQLSVDNTNINYLTSCTTSGTGTPSCPSQLTVTNNGGLLSTSSSASSNQTVYCPSFPFDTMQAVQNVQNSTKQEMFTANDISYVYTDANNQNYKREIFEEVPASTLEQITDQLAAVENCNSLISTAGASSLMAASTAPNTTTVSDADNNLQDLQQEMSQFCMLSVVDHHQWMYSECLTHSFILN